MASDTVDYIVVGQGIAGSMLALELMRTGYSVIILDNAHASAACLVAAGVLNPVTGKRLVKSPQGALALPFAAQRYAELESILDAKFFHERRILCLTPERSMQEALRLRLADPEYAAFLSKPNPPNFFAGENLNDALGSFFINFSAWVEPPALMLALKNFFLKSGALRRESFDYSALRGTSDGVEYKGITARGAIFCSGFKDAQNPFFKWLNFRPAKGEILTMELLDENFTQDIIHRNKWIMRTPDGGLRTGSTWDRVNLDSAPTKEAEDELLLNAKKFFVNPQRALGKILSHTAGVRPCTASTRPFIGFHPLDGRLGIFNGFGSKGFALSPFFARMFAEHIAYGKPLDRLCDTRKIKSARVNFGSAKNCDRVL